MEMRRPYILTIAGFDPSSGAGITADIKTMEQLQCYGLAVQTANTIQTDKQFIACDWIAQQTIKEQLKTLLSRFEIEFIKVGIVENWKFLLECIGLIKQFQQNIKIILDPVLRSTTEFEFHGADESVLDEILAELYLITPNGQEIEKLYASLSVEETIKHISKKTNLLLKGGHNNEFVGQDVLYLQNKNRININPELKNCTEKHGSGCVLSSAITSYLALDFSLEESCRKGKLYTERLLSSNETLLGYHNH